MRNRPKMTAKVLVAHNIADRGTPVAVRLAILVKSGKDVERVVTVEVERVFSEGSKPRTDEEVRLIAEEKAMFPAIGSKGVKILASVYDGGTFTGIGQPTGGA